jgi:hypothetical protein
MQKVGDDQIGVLETVKRAEERGTECQVGIQRLGQRGNLKRQP